MGPIIIVDCNNLGYAAAYTTGGLAYQALPTGVLYGFLNQIFKLSDMFGSNRFVFCWDSRKSYRKLIYPEYKANRKKDLTFEEQRNLKIMFEQFVALRKTVLPRLGFKNVFLQTGYESDDLIAHIVQRIPDRYVVISSDNDLWQLIDRGRKDFSWVKVFSPNTKKLWDYAEFVSKWGIEPKDWARVKAMAGCATDGVVGVKGVGELTAVKIITGLLKKAKLWIGFRIARSLLPAMLGL